MLQVAAILITAFISLPVFAATCTSTGSGGNWSNTGTWTGCNGNTPGSNDTAIIATTGTNVVTANVAITVGNVVVNSGKLNIAGSNWTVSGTTTINNSGTIDETNTGGNVIFTGLVTVNTGGTWANTINEAFNFRGGITNNGTFNSGSGTYTFDTNNQAINGTISINNVTVTGVTLTNNNTLTVPTALSGTGGLTNSGTGTLNIGGTSGITTLTASAAGNTVNYTGAAQTVNPTTYHHLGLSGSGAKTLTNVSTINGNLTLSGTATATTAVALSIGGNMTVGTGSTFTSANFTNLVSGTTSVTGTLAHSGLAAKTYAGTVTINAGGVWTNAGNAPVTFRGGLTHNGTTFTAGSGIYTFDTNNQAIGGSSAIAIPSVTVTGVTLTNNGTLTVATDLSGTGGLTNSGTGTLNIGGTSGIATLTASASGNTVNYTGAAQTVIATTYHHLGLSGSGAKTFTSATVNGDLSLSGSATATLTGVSTISGNVTTSGTATATTAVALSIGGNLTVGTGSTFTSANFTNLVSGTTLVTGTLAHSGAAAKTYAGAVTINANGAWTNAGNAPVTFRGGLTHNGTTFTAGSGIYTFDTNNQAIGGSSAIAIPSVTVTGVTLTNNGTLTVATDLSGTGGLTNSGTGTLNIGGTSGITTLTATAAGNTVSYTGTGQTIKATAYDTLNVTGTATNTGTVTAAAVLGGAGALTNSGSGTLSIGGTSTITTLTATAAGNIVNYTGTGQIIKATAYDTLNVTGTATNSGTVTVATALSGSGTLTNSAAGTLNIGGTSGITTLTATAAGNTVSYTGTGQTIKATAYDTLSVTGTATNSGTVTVATALSGSGTLTNSALGTLNIGGTSGITTLTATAVGNTVNYTGAAQTVKATTYHHLGLSGSGAKTFTSATVNGDLSLSGSATATLTGVSTITGNVTTSGTATATTAANLSIGGNLTVGTGSAFTSANFTNLVSGTTSVTGTLAHSGLAAKTYTGTVTINAGGVWTNAGNAPITFSGGFAQNGTFTSGSGTYTFNGSSAQTITGTPTFQNLTVNSNGGVTLSTGSVTVSTLLTLTSGTVTTGGNTLIASGGNCTTSISSSNGYVIGNLQLTVPVTNPVTCSYPVGDSIGYAPISITKSGTNTGTLIGRVDSGDHPDGSSTVGINQAKNANHYWTLTAGTLSAATPYTATFQFCATGTCVVPTELDTGANTSNFVVAKKSGTWSNQTVGTKNATSTQANGLTGFGVFEVGEQGSLNCTSLATGNWNTAATWTNCHGGVPLAGDTVTIVNTHTVTLDTTAPATGSLGSLTINSGGILTASVANTLTLGGNLTNNGTLSFGTFGSVTLTTASQWTGTGATWTLNNLTLGSQALSFNATDTFTLGINGSISGLGTINSGATNTGITLDFRSASTQTVPTAGVTYPNLTVSGGGTKTPASGTLDIRGNFTVASSTTFAGNSNNPVVALKGNFSNSGTFNAGSGAWTLSGTSAQSIAGAPSFGSLTINNAVGVSLSSNVTASTSLTLTSGTITTGVNTLIYSNSNCSTSPIIRITGYVIGNLQLTVPANNPVTCSYPVGDSIGYAPISITKSGTNTGTLTGRADSGDHPDTATSASGIDATKSANHYWTLTAGTLSASTPYTATFQFCSNSGLCTVTEVDSVANTSNFIVALKSAGIWTSQTAGTRNAYSTQATGITSFGEFAVGELSTNNCYNDGFTGSNGASPGTNWSVGYKTGTFGNPIIYGNRLRLTDTSGAVATWATLQRLFPAAGNKVTIEFDHFSYDGTGGDGIAVVLSDASVAPVVGAFGGSLGYAQKGQNPISDCNTTGGCPGFAGGWLGVALDEFGNYSTNIEGRFGGGASIIPNSVAVRGSGSGMSGYRFLQGTVTLSPAVEDNNTANPPYRYRIIVDHTDNVHAWASVERDTTGGGTAYTTLIGCPPGVTSGCTAFDVKDPGNSQNAVPAYWNLSFTGSTGGSANIHEIDTLKVCTVQGLASPVLHHIKIEHGGTACTSNAATITVKACADAACDALYMGSVTVNLSTTGGTWSPTSPITFSGGQTTVTLTDTTSRSDTLGATATSPTAANATQCYNGTTQTCSLTFAACTFDVVEVGAAVNTPIYTKLANTTFNLDVVSRSGSSQTLTAIELVDMSSGTCSSPAAVLSPVALSPALTGGVPNFTANQSKTFSFAYNNASPNVRVRVTTAGPLYSCSSDNFAIRPQTFNLTSNATQAGSSGMPVFRAGTDPFTLFATAVYSATTTNNYAGTPKLNLTSGMVTQYPLTLPHLGSLGSTTFSAAVSGIATASNLTYSEVGSFSLAQYAVYDDTFANVDSVKGECSSGFSNTLANNRFSCQFGSDAAGAFGRFVPDHFRVSGTIANACSTGTFTYMGQSFSLSTTNVVAAENAANSVTQNYTGSYATGTVSFGAEDLDNGTDISSRLTFASGSWASGIYTLTNASGTFTRPTSAVSDATWGPFESLDIGLTVNDSDVTTSPKVSSADMNPSVAGGSSFTYKKFSGSPLRMRLGRLSLQNAYGSELLALPIPVEAQYWKGNYYTVNTDDSCTAFPASSIIMDNYLQNLSACETHFSPADGLAMSSGILNTSLNLTASGAGNTGSVDLTLNIGSSASGNTCTTPVQAAATAANMSWFGTNPTVRATFGIYEGNSRFIYIRELY